MDSSGDLMPLPDADKKSPRVYTLSQNTDLENMAFATMQSIGQPINIEELNEDELRRLVLVNLARLAVKGEWEGLLSAGGGSNGFVDANPNGDWQSGRLDFQNACFSHGRNSKATDTPDFSTDRPQFWPFTAVGNGALTSMQIYCTQADSGGTIRVGIYNMADDGNPSSLIGYGDFDVSTTGFKTVTSFSSTISLTRGTGYWYAFVRETSGSGTPKLNCMDTNYNAAINLSDDSATAFTAILDYTNTGDLTDPADTADMRGASTYKPPHLALSWL